MATRADKRSSSTIRPILITPCLLSRDGSASFSFGKSRVLCTVNGPAEVKLRDEKLDKATIDVVVRPLVGAPGTKDKTHEYILRSTFESIVQSGLHPRTQIQIVSQVMVDDGSIIAAAINATTMALIDAGIPMKDIVAAVSCVINKDDQILLDPTLQEMENIKSVHTFAFNKTTSSLLFCESLGLFTDDQYFNCYELCNAAAGVIFDKMREFITNKLKEEYQIES
ncbi:ribosomal protein S5 domain 2-like protein [Rhizophagus irregularis]|uniref:Ribosomal protein S5 domain 2-like protein n=4 Tax=Rhizophagus irregularis TaxID=588596 RepID=A0A2I1EDE6_9GLOM|nr:Rrp46p [Rhizophagus irregularis DAOM 197198w]PKC16237.1 ribosomal protein S5 domain 2-like protein [Rhizophagus irregularis]GBC53344.1 exosome complex component RRP46 [Rhizophagus irregularis DAOM 181602=DAOM 197198]PKC65611.1 ribosomal protein S5 domain 2-like protein [Rhizophagus irregularis]PKK70831.1 ribosomal protein S5 domain 2-like protein [Rhizophagus irregularis]